MENNTKIAIGLAAAVVVGYIVYNKSKNPKTVSIPSDYKGGNYMDVIIPKGTKFEGCKVWGYGVDFDTKEKFSQYDGGGGNARWGEFEVTSVVSNEREPNPAPYEKPKMVNGYPLYIGNVVNIVLTKDVKRSAQMKPIIYT